MIYNTFKLKRNYSLNKNEEQGEIVSGNETSRYISISYEMK